MLSWRLALSFCVATLTLGACASNPEPAAVRIPESAPVAAPIAAPAPVVAPSMPSIDAPTSPIASSSAPAASPITTPAERAPGDSFTRYLEELSATSCPSAVRGYPGSAISLKIAPVRLSGVNPGLKRVGELNFVGGFHLTSDSGRFGGLSGIAALEDGNLLAVTDAGDFVWIDLARDGFTPTAARLSGMRQMSGALFDAKSQGDAEGLAMLGGLAVVSFEGDHRVLAFDVGKCGAEARGAPVNVRHGRSLERQFDVAGLDVGSNEGAEALAMTRDGYMIVGLETRDNGSGPVSARAMEAPAAFDLRLTRGAPELVGMDTIAAGENLRLFSLHRGAGRLLGSPIEIIETRLIRGGDYSGAPARAVGEIAERNYTRFTTGATRRLAQMSLVLTIDNYEGIAARELADGTVRLFVVSDDNFSTRQRTLLMVFDLPPGR